MNPRTGRSASPWQRVREAAAFHQCTVTKESRPLTHEFPNAAPSWLNFNRDVSRINKNCSRSSFESPARTCCEVRPSATAETFRIFPGPQSTISSLRKSRTGRCHFWSSAFADIVALMSVTSFEWLAAFAKQLGIDAPNERERDDLLALAGTAAHASERIAAPIACWMAARAGITPSEACDVALQLVVPGSPDN
jgi:hypothetical protein